MNLPSPGRKHPALWALALAFTLVYVSWGTTYMAIKKGVREGELPPALFGGSRVALAGLLLLGFQFLRGDSLRITWPELKTMTGVGWLYFVGGNGLITLAQTTVESGVAAVLAATVPLWMAIFSLLWPAGERLNPWGWLGLFIGLAGVVVLLSPNLHDPAAFFRDLGPFFVLGSACCWAVGSLVVRYCSWGTPHLTAAAYQMILGGGSLTLIGFFLGDWGRLPQPLPLEAIYSFLYLLLVGSLVGFVAFNWLLGHVSAAKVGTYSYVNPVVAVLIGWLFGEELNVWIVSGIAVILAGVALVRGGETPPTRIILPVQLLGEEGKEGIPESVPG